MKKLFKLNLIGVSSCASQLGFLIAHKNYQYKPANQYLMGEIYIILRPTLALGNLQTYNFLDKNALCFLLGISTTRFFSIVGKGFIIKIIYLVFTMLSSLLNIFLDLIIWQPKPNWLPTNFSLFNRNFTIPSQKIIYYGDGFMQQILDNSPFWLNSSRHSSCSTPTLKNSISFFLFSISPSPLHQDYHSYRLDPCAVLEFFDIIFKHDLISFEIIQWLEQLSGSIAASKKKILIFPTSSFFETNRALLENELSLYRESISLIHAFEDESLLIKLHPRTDKSKLVAFAAGKTSFLDLNTFENWKMNSEIATVVPLELIVYYLTRISFVCSEQDISIAVSSTAALSCALLFRDLKFKLLFGQKLVSKYLFPEYIDSRLHQESVLKNSLYQLFN